MTRWIPEEVALSEEAQEKILRLWLDFARTEALSGRRVDGSSLPPGVDLYQSGRLFKEVRVQGGKLTFLTPYAEVLESRYHFVSVQPSGAFWSLPQVKAAIEEGLSFVR